MAKRFEARKTKAAAKLLMISREMRRVFLWYLCSRIRQTSGDWEDSNHVEPCFPGMK